MTSPIDAAWGLLKAGFGELDMVLREEGQAAALAWLAERGVTGEDAMRIITPTPEWEPGAPRAPEWETARLHASPGEFLHPALNARRSIEEGDDGKGMALTGQQGDEEYFRRLLGGQAAPNLASHVHPHDVGWPGAPAERMGPEDFQPAFDEADLHNAMRSIGEAPGPHDMGKFSGSEEWQQMMNDLRTRQAN